MKAKVLTFNFEKERSRRLRAIMVWLATVLSLAVLTNWVQGQDYESLPIHPDYIFPDLPDDLSRQEKKAATDKIKDAITAGRNAVKSNAKEGNANFGAAGDKYVRNYLLAEMTQTEPEKLGQLGSQRTAIS